MENQLQYSVGYVQPHFLHDIIKRPCKGCDVTFNAEELRIAPMVQSKDKSHRYADAWYHFECFFKKHRPKCCDLIIHFSTLKQDDQRKFREKVNELAQTSPNGLEVQYSKSKRANCRICGWKIMEGIRIKNFTFDTELGVKISGGEPLYYHLKCFAKCRAHPYFDYNESGDKLIGFENLTIFDQDKVRNTIKSITEASAVKKLKLEDEDCEQIVTVDEIIGHPKLQLPKPMLYEMLFFVFGNIQNNLKDIIAACGGQVSDKLTKKITAVISNEKELHNIDKRMKNRIKKLRLKIISEHFFIKLNHNPDTIMEQFEINIPT